MEVSNELVVVVIDEGTSKAVGEVDNWREVPNSSVPLQDVVIISVTVGSFFKSYQRLSLMSELSTLPLNNSNDDLKCNPLFVWNLYVCLDVSTGCLQ